MDGGPVVRCRGQWRLAFRARTTSVAGPNPSEWLRACCPALGSSKTYRCPFLRVLVVASCSRLLSPGQVQHLLSSRASGPPGCGPGHCSDTSNARGSGPPLRFASREQGHSQRSPFGGVPTTTKTKYHPFRWPSLGCSQKHFRPHSRRALSALARLRRRCSSTTGCRIQRQRVAFPASTDIDRPSNSCESRPSL